MDERRIASPERIRAQLVVCGVAVKHDVASSSAWSASSVAAGSAWRPTSSRSCERRSTFAAGLRVIVPGVHVTDPQRRGLQLDRSTRPERRPGRTPHVIRRMGSGSVRAKAHTMEGRNDVGGGGELQEIFDGDQEPGVIDDHVQDRPPRNRSELGEVRVFGPQTPIRSARSKSGSIRTWSNSARGAGPRASRRARSRRSSSSSLTSWRLRRRTIARALDHACRVKPAHGRPSGELHGKRRHAG